MLSHPWLDSGTSASCVKRDSELRDLLGRRVRAGAQVSAWGSETRTSGQPYGHVQECAEGHVVQGG